MSTSARVILAGGRMRVRILVCLVALGCMQTAMARMDTARCLRGHTGSQGHHACTLAPRLDHAGSGRGK
ncbi:MAG: hypothetical protein JO299_10855 [Gammaproteobacteria bacterium]|nr:hypothetical protein [Gammaproteobacteria bacterium]